MARKTKVEATVVEVPATAEPRLTITERIGYQLSSAFDEETGFARGWNAAEDPEVVAIRAEREVRERARCKAAVLAMLRK